MNAEKLHLSDGKYVFDPKMRQFIINGVQKYFEKFNALFLFSTTKMAKRKSREIWLRQNRELSTHGNK